MSVLSQAASADRPTRIHTAVELALALILAGVTAYGAWRVTAPAPPAPMEAAPAAMASAWPDHDPFFGRADAGAAPVAAADLDLVLYGTRSSGGAPAAIIAGPDGRQRSFRAGEEVMPGMRLQAVAGDHVTLAGPSGLHRLAFTPFQASGGQSAPAAVPASTPSGSAALSGVPDAVAGDPSVVRGGHPVEAYASALRPQRREGRVAGYVWRPGRDLDVLAAAGLRPGDVVTRLNGMDFDNDERVQELADELALRRPVQVEFERDGRRRTVTFTP